MQLVFHAGTNGYTHGEHGRDCDFEKEHGKVSVVLGVNATRQIRTVKRGKLFYFGIFSVSTLLMNIA